MARYAIVNAANIVYNIAISDSPLDADGVWVDLTGISPEPAIGWLYVDGVFSPPPPTPVPALPNIITKIAMITRFTDSEFTGILAASKTDVEVEGWYARFYAAAVINLDDQRTINGIEMLVAKNLLTPVRGHQILTDPVQPDERP